MVKELILDNDKVVLPGLGCFVAEIVPSTFSDKGYTINPPYRRLYFRSKPDEGNQLIDFYASSNNLEHSLAEHIITDFISGLKSVLHTRKMVMFPGLGRLRATRENNLFFVADENLDIYPSGFGLEPVSMKNHQETKEEVSAAVEDLASMLSPTAPISEEPAPVFLEPTPVPLEPALDSDTPADDAIDLEVDDSASVMEPEPVPEPEIDLAVEPVPEPVPEIPVEEAALEEEKSQSESLSGEKAATTVKPIWKKILAALGITLAAVALLLAAFVLVAHLAPDFMDRLLYSKEELEVLHYRF
ncbi:MAG: hypothetical protein ACI3ZL_08570 [Candidatus Cryptobacteroides sp.]